MPKQVKKLPSKYPNIFQKIHSIETEDGWYDLLDQLCRNLQFDIDANGYPQVVAAQVKEKFGGLRFYYDTIMPETLPETKDIRRDMGIQEGMIRFAESLSYNICQRCGSNHEVTRTTGWIVTLCAECMKEHAKTKI